LFPKYTWVGKNYLCKNMVNWSVSNWNQLRKDIIDWHGLLSSESVVGYMNEVRV